MCLWVWVFGDVAGLRWVLEHRQMAFRASAAARICLMGPGDRAILYLSRGAFHNPTRDVSRLGGVVRVVGTPQKGKVVEIAGRKFEWFVPIEAEVVLPERHGPDVKLLAARLELVKRPDVWGQYFRTSPIEVGERDFEVMAGALKEFASARR